MYKSILVPLDGSAFAEGAIGPAITLAEKAGGRVCLLAVHCHPTDDAAVDPEAAKKYLRDVMIRFRPVTSSSIATKVRFGPEVAVEIAAEASAHDLIVMTSHGRGGLARAWFGSVADECVRTSSTPILVLRPLESGPASLRLEISKVVVPLDGSELAETILPTAAYVADLLDVPITLLRSVVVPVTSYVGYFPQTDSRLPVDDAEAYLQQIVSTHLAGLRQRPTVQVTIGPHAARDICELAGSDSLIAMATHGRGGAQRTFLGSITDEVIRATESVVLVLRPGGNVESPRDAEDGAEVFGRVTL